MQQQLCSRQCNQLLAVQYCYQSMHDLLDDIECLSHVQHWVLRKCGWVRHLCISDIQLRHL